MALLAVPLMSLVISPIQAAGIMLPILIAMDFLSIWVYRKTWDGRNLTVLLPAAIVGITIGGLTARWVNDDIIRLLVGAIAVTFSLYRWAAMSRSSRAASQSEPLEPRPPSKLLGVLWGACSGFTSFLAHAGSPPYQVYVIPQRLSKQVYAGTSLVFFATVNAIKLIPYGMLGQLSPTNLSVSAMLLPLVPMGVFIGVRINRRLPEKTFYTIVMTAVFLVGIKLIWDGVSNVMEI